MAQPQAATEDSQQTLRRRPSGIPRVGLRADLLELHPRMVLFGALRTSPLPDCNPNPQVERPRANTGVNTEIEHCFSSTDFVSSAMKN